MFKTRKVIKYSILVFVVSIILYIGLGVKDYFEFKNVASAISGMPWQSGGKISFVRPLCVLDTPPTSPVTCAISCPLVTEAVGPACVGFIEIDVAPSVAETGRGNPELAGQLAAIPTAPFIAAPVGFLYRGGGSYPVAGMSYLTGGSSNIAPWVIGIPPAPGGFSGYRHKLLETVDKFIIAAFRN